MGEIQPNKCEGRELTKDQLGHDWRRPGRHGADPRRPLQDCERQCYSELQELHLGQPVRRSADGRLCHRCRRRLCHHHRRRLCCDTAGCVRHLLQLPARWPTSSRGTPGQLMDEVDAPGLEAGWLGGRRSYVSLGRRCRRWGQLLHTGRHGLLLLPDRRRCGRMESVLPNRGLRAGPQYQSPVDGAGSRQPRPRDRRNLCGCWRQKGLRDGQRLGRVRAEREGPAWQRRAVLRAPYAVHRRRRAAVRPKRCPPCFLCPNRPQRKRRRGFPRKGKSERSVRGTGGG